jgi:hypothetical protein
MLAAGQGLGQCQPQVRAWPDERGFQDQRAGMRSFLENGPGKATFTGR